MKQLEDKISAQNLEIMTLKQEAEQFLRSAASFMEKLEFFLGLPDHLQNHAEYVNSFPCPLLVKQTRGSSSMYERHQTIDLKTYLDEFLWVMEKITESNLDENLDEAAFDQVFGAHRVYDYKTFKTIRDIAKEVIPINLGSMTIDW